MMKSCKTVICFDINYKSPKDCMNTENYDDVFLATSVPCFFRTHCTTTTSIEIFYK